MTTPTLAQLNGMKRIEYTDFSAAISHAQALLNALNSLLDVLPSREGQFLPHHYKYPLYQSYLAIKAATGIDRTEEPMQKPDDSSTRIFRLEAALRGAGQTFELLTAFEPGELSEVKVIARKSAENVRKALEAIRSDAQ